MLWVRELDSLGARPLPGTEVAAFPFWSPDSRSIGFVDVDLEIDRVRHAPGAVRDHSLPDPEQHVDESVRGCERWAELSVESAVRAVRSGDHGPRSSIIRAWREQFPTLHATYDTSP